MRTQGLCEESGPLCVGGVRSYVLGVLRTQERVCLGGGGCVCEFEGVPVGVFVPDREGR